LPPECPIDTINYIIENSNSEIVLTHNDYQKLVNKDIKVIDIDKEFMKYTGQEIHINNINLPEDYQSILYTSGTTGNPKGTITLHKNIVNLRESLKDMEEFNPTNKDVSISSLSYSFDGFGLQLFLTLLYGGKTIICDKTIGIHEVIQIMKKEKVSILFQTIVYFYELAQELENLEPGEFSLRWVITGGELVKTRKFLNFRNNFKQVKLYNVYGPTEAGMICFYHLITEQDILENNGTIGRPLKYCKAVVVNENNEVLPIDEEGELLLYGDNVGDGYLGLEELTRDKYIELPFAKGKTYKTGDIVRLNNRLQIDFIGRRDNRVKIKGNLVEIDGLEKIISEIGNVRESSIIPISENNANYKILICFVDDNVDINAFKQELSKKVRHYMMPKYIFKIDNMPKNKNGKIDKNKLKELAFIEIEKFKNTNKNNIIKPNTDMEKTVYQIIQDMSDKKEFSITDDLYNDLGFDSLMSIVLSTKLHANNIFITPQEINDNSSVLELSKFVKDYSENEKLDSSLVREYKNLRVLNNSKRPNLSSVLITGITGFLGSHILYELIRDDEVKDIHCIIRGKKSESAYKRLKETLEYYFAHEDLEKLESKIRVVEGNITEYKFGLKESQYNDLSKNITTVINVAANVKHLGKYEEFYNDNVQSVSNVIDLCKINKASLIHVSTLSVCGYIEKERNNILFNENMINIEQNFLNNPYIQTKFEAECKLLKEADSLNIKIFRLGNIMPRYSDGVFQKNVEHNGFIHLINSIIKNKTTSDSLINIDVDISPVDKCSESIIKLTKTSNNQTIYHIANINYIKIKDLVDFMASNNIDFDKINNDEFETVLNSSSDIGYQYIKNNISNYKYEPINYDLTYTVEELKKQNFEWPQIEKTYLEMLFKYTKKLLVK